MKRLLAVFVLLVAAKASAQTYVRPSKGTPINLYTSAQNAASATISSYYDWTSFYSVNLVVTFAKADGTACACPLAAGRVQCRFNFTKFNIKGTADKTVTDFNAMLMTYNRDGTATELFGNLATDGFAVGNINIQTPYIKTQFRTGTYTDYSGAAIATPCIMKVVATPLPNPYRFAVEGDQVYFDVNTYRSPVGFPQAVTTGGFVWDNEVGANANLPANIDISSGAMLVRQHTRPKLGQFDSEQVVQVAQYAKVCANDAACGNTGGFLNSCVAGFCSTTMVAEVSGYPQSGVRLQNVGTNPAICAAGENAANLSSTLYTFVLKADTAANAGNGGVMEIPFLYSDDAAKRRVYCAGNGGDTVILGMLY